MCVIKPTLTFFKIMILFPYLLYPQVFFSKKKSQILNSFTPKLSVFIQIEKT